ncbi:hypothetical protein [Nocardia wallacei]|nr:hypothetical protein [Nocardia wallacei]
MLFGRGRAVSGAGWLLLLLVSGLVSLTVALVGLPLRGERRSDRESRL